MVSPSSPSGAPGLSDEQVAHFPGEGYALEPDPCSLHGAPIPHGSQSNPSPIRGSGWTLRFGSPRARVNPARFAGGHRVSLAKGRDRGGNSYAEPARAYPEVTANRGESSRFRHGH
jgi:hypothetical protein